MGKLQIILDAVIVKELKKRNAVPANMISRSHMGYLCGVTQLVSQNSSYILAYAWTICKGLGQSCEHWHGMGTIMNTAAI